MDSALDVEWQCAIVQVVRHAERFYVAGEVALTCCAVCVLMECMVQVVAAHHADGPRTSQCNDVILFGDNEDIPVGDVGVTLTFVVCICAAMEHVD